MKFVVEIKTFLFAVAVAGGQQPRVKSVPFKRWPPPIPLPQKSVPGSSTTTDGTYHGKEKYYWYYGSSTVPVPGSCSTLVPEHLASAQVPP